MWTLVQHSGFVRGDHSEFEHAVEVRSVTPREAARCRSAGGLVFSDYREASDMEFALNYPPGNEGLVPTFRGTFSTKLIEDSPIAIPRYQPVP